MKKLKNIESAQLRTLSYPYRAMSLTMESWMIGMCKKLKYNGGCCLIFISMFLLLDIIWVYVYVWKWILSHVNMQLNLLFRWELDIRGNENEVCLHLYICSFILWVNFKSKLHNKLCIYAETNQLFWLSSFSLIKMSIIFLVSSLVHTVCSGFFLL